MTLAGSLASAFTYAPPSETLLCPIRVVGARPAHKKLPIGKRVTLIKRITTVPQCALHLVVDARLTKGDVRPAILHINHKTGKITIVALSSHTRATVRATTVPTKLPYNRHSPAFTRTWAS